jgi:hypothetical protein
VRGTFISLQGSQLGDDGADSDASLDVCLCDWSEWSSSTLLSQASLASRMILISLPSSCLKTHDGTWIGFSTVERSSSP